VLCLLTRFRPQLFPPAATFVFQNPAVFEASSELGDITGLYMTDDEGTLQVRGIQ
jgi:photosystem II protein